MHPHSRINHAVLLAIAGLALPSQAQQAQPPAATTLERIEVTGSRIRTISAVSSSPVTSIGREEINSSQPVAVEDVVKGLPSAVPAMGPATNNGTTGAATLDLRGLGSRRSLVLIDGRRMVPFDLDGQVDSNIIPIALLKRIDLVTGGASAVYGADAVTGVANFVLNRQFKGVELSSSYGQSGDGDAGRKRTDITMGGAFADGRGHMVLSLGTAKTTPLLQGQRPYSMVGLSSTNGAQQGSGTGVPGTFQVPSIAGLPAGTPSLANMQIDPATGQLVAPYASYNFNPPNYFITPLDRRQATALATLNLGQHLELYADLFHTRSTVVSNLASSATFLNVYQVPIGNPLMPEAMRQQVCQVRGIAAADCVVGNATEVPMAIGRRFTELGPRINDFETRTQQVTVGARGAINDIWSYDTHFANGDTNQVQTRGNWGSNAKVQQALRALSPTACTNPANGCVPLNVFGAEGSITPQMLNFVNLNALILAKVKQKVAAGSVSGELGAFKSPWSPDPIGVAMGAEYREVFAANASDAASQIQGEVLGTGAPRPDRSGTIEFKEFFAEASVPLLARKPLAHKLGLELGYRRTQMTTVASTSYGSWKLGGDWEPVQGLRVRLMGQRATRAPNTNELFAPQTAGLSNLAVDPCQGNRINAADANTAGTLSNLCRLTGVPMAAVGSLPAPSAGQINNTSGGNPSLGPEVADTQTLGFVFQPTSLPRLTLSVDYFRIQLDKAISAPSVTDVLTDCYDPARNPGLGLNAACALVMRGPLGTFNGATSPGVVTPQSNLGKLWTSGVDLGVNYLLDLKQLGLDARWGKVDLSLNAAFTSDYSVQTTPNAVKRQCLGYYSVACSNLNQSATVSGTGYAPRTKFTQRATWTVGNWTLGYNWRHIGKMQEEPGGTDFLPAYASIKAHNYVDLSASWKVNEMLRLNLSVNNAFDKQPPIVGNTISGTGVNAGNTFPTVYDVIGRYITVGATLKF
ncbi:MAG: TonB-dependent receptor [Burkholderiaceae bacterium]|nr:TonB-dependent receptor [Burkholderiaceae bacterium]